MLSTRIEDWARRMARRVVGIIAIGGITPNRITFIGMLLNFPVAWVLFQGPNWWLLGGFFSLFAAVFDMLDGALAKVTNRVSVFGAFFDSNLDRYGEMICLFGLLLYYTNGGGKNLDNWAAGLIFAAVAGSTMVSYSKARAEGLGLQCKVGWLPRPERVVILALGLILTPVFSSISADFSLIVALWILAIGTNLTAIQRIVYVYNQSKILDQAKAAEAASIVQSAQPAPFKAVPLAPATDEQARLGERLRRRWLASRN